MNTIECAVKLSPQEKKIELCKDIVATASLVIKLRADGEIFDSQINFINFLNEAGFRTVTGKEFTKMSFRNMWSRLTPREVTDIFMELDAERDQQLIEAFIG